MDIQDISSTRLANRRFDPEGFVTTYGDVARLAGSPRAARQVGGV